MWSKFQQWAAALACGLLLLNAAPAVWAAQQQPSGKPVAGKKTKAGPAARSVKGSAKPAAKPAVKQSAQKTASKQARIPAKKSAGAVRRQAASPSRSLVGAADLLDAGAVGLHGRASFYGQGFHGRKTSAGERFDPREFTAASNHFPLGTLVAVRRMDIDRCAIVKINDRMHTKHRQRVIDVSRGVAEHLEMVRAGVVLVSVAPLKDEVAVHGAGACQAAFEPENECLACGQPQRLPDFDGASRIQPD